MDSPDAWEAQNDGTSDLKHTAAEQGKNVVETAKDEASSVVGEAKGQAKELYHQTQREVKDQAAAQQHRLASGMRSVSEDLNAMASQSSASGIATDLARQVSTRLSAASNWLDDRDPGAVLEEVKRFARRKPGTFILGALVVGVVVGRLTRALAATAADEKSDAAQLTTGSERDAWTPAPVNGAVESDASLDTPIYTQSTSAWQDAPGSEDGDGRRDSV